MYIQKLSAYLEISEHAIAAVKAERNLKEAKEWLAEAYKLWREDNGVEYVEKGSSQWAEMLGATNGAYKELKKARAAAYNAKRRLNSAVVRLEKSWAGQL